MVQEYQRSYDAAFAKIYAAIDSEDHPRNCGTCRACGVIRAVIESTMMQLGSLLTEAEFNALAAMLARVKRDN